MQILLKFKSFRNLNFKSLREKVCGAFRLF